MEKQTEPPSPYERLLAVGVPPEVSAAYDIMRDDDVPAETAAQLAVVMHKRGDAEAQARHFVRLRKALR